MNTDILLGKTTEHLVPLEGTNYLIHRNVISDFLKLQKEAKIQGFDLQVVSAFRDFDRQQKIWNMKASGERTLLDDQGNPLEYDKLSPIEIMFAILRWSALPGTSRHHWGTDLDIFDEKKQRADSVKLIPSECIGDGPSAELHKWLDSLIESNSSFGFFRPYSTDRGGVNPERWHLSYRSLSQQYMECYTSTLFKKNIEASNILLKQEVMANADEIFQRFLINIDI